MITVDAVTISINDAVRVRLTERGEAIYRDRQWAVGETMKRQEDGSYITQLWHLFGLFHLELRLGGTPVLERGEITVMGS